MTSTLATIFFSILPLTYPSFPDLAYMACTYALQFPFWSHQGTLSNTRFLDRLMGTPHCLDSKIHRSWIVHSEGLPIFFSICFLAFSFLSLVPHVSFVPATFLGSDIHVTVFLLSTFSSSSPFMGSYFYALGTPLFYFLSHVPFFTRYSAAG